MKTDNLLWYAVEREELPNIVLGIDSLAGRESILGPSSHFSDSPARVAFSRGDLYGASYHPPSLILLRNKSCAETLSWLRVFAREAFPLSQFSRVTTDADWELFDSDQSRGRVIRTDKWACIVLGEMLAQGESDMEIDSIPLSRAGGCFSASIARSELLHDSFAVTRTCADRLRNISDDSRFAKRTISIDALAPVWGGTSAILSDTSDMLEIVELALFASEASVHDSHAELGHPRSILKIYPQLFSDSVEERVVAFQRMASDILANPVKLRRSSSMDASLLAVGAFLVGRGTSHAFLLRKYPTIAPMAFVWFGLMAAFHGPQGWDPVWLRVTKGVERQIRASFNWEDPPSADICWTEYEWLTRTLPGTLAFSDLCRLVPRALSVEIVPGVVCQFRTAAESKPVEDFRRGQPSNRESEMRSTLELLISLADKAKQLLDPTKPKELLPRQSDLGFVKDPTPARSSKTKRNYKRPADK